MDRLTCRRRQAITNPSLSKAEDWMASHVCAHWVLQGSASARDMMSVSSLR